MGSRSLCVILAMLVVANCYFADEQHKTHFANLVTEFSTFFKERFDVITLAEMDWHTKMELAFGYWITAIKIRGIKKAEFKYDLEINGLVLSAPELTIELLIEDKYTVPIKISNFQFSVLIYTDKDNFRCTGTQIEYDDISLDINSVIEYFSKQLLSLDLVKDAIKKSEIPLRNLIARSFRDNWERLKPLVQRLKSGKTDTKDWLRQALSEVNGIEAKGEEFVLKTRTLFNLKSERVPELQEDL